jgi:hypothetical protein
MGVGEALLRWTRRGSAGFVGSWELGGGGKGRPTLETRLDHVQGVDGEGGYRAGGEAGDGLDQRGGEARMVFIHKGRGTAVIIMVWKLLARENSGGGYDDAEALAKKYFSVCRG